MSGWERDLFVCELECSIWLITLVLVSDGSLEEFWVLGAGVPLAWLLRVLV